MFKKCIFLFALIISVLTLHNFTANALNIKNKKEEIVVYEEIIYNEIVYENGKIKEQNKLNKAEYEKKVKEKKEKKLEDYEVITPMWVPDDPCDEDPYFPGCPPKTSLIVSNDPHPDNVLVNCTSINYTYCEGNAETETAYTTHKSKVYLNPQTDTGRVEDILIWDIVPVNRLYDLMAVGFYGTNDIFVDMTQPHNGVSALAEYWWDTKYEDEYYGIIKYESTSEYDPNYYYYDINDDFMLYNNDIRGVIFNVDLKNDTTTYGQCPTKLGYGEYDMCYITEIANKIRISLNVDFNNESGIEWYNNYNQVLVYTDYLHQIGLVDTDVNLGISLSGPSLGIGLVPDHYYDAYNPYGKNDRLNEIVFDLRN